jgi:hypothetical protein
MQWRVPKLTRYHRVALGEQLRCLSWDERARLIKQAKKDACKHWLYWTPMLPTFAAAAIFIITFNVYHLHSTGLVVLVTLCCGVLAVSGYLLHEIIDFRYRVHALAEHFPHLCRVCGYDRRGLNGPCPECGTDSRTNVSTVSETEMRE